MEEVLMQSTITTRDKSGNVILDIESLVQPLDKCCNGSPKLKKVLSRKGSWRCERRNSEEQEVDEASKKLVVKVVPSQLEQLKQPIMPNKALISVQSPAANNTINTDSGDGKSKRLKSLLSINPRKILLLFATVSSMGTMILIYFTLAINRRG
ncbi:uncharacterized protein A4U43_UnF3590 [Asparagus officinalis]|uniref:Uncharacterized protein n=1 Tax=Asparagus officinalis TaxID=4686 RepID=A0A1R3L729_ASPOF|nr:uncharacterized protein LOC109827378 [Asparagus officinalis]XP_020249972.1 uncharacterized protein LOC109827378 [Asparagus officinalis]XP_020249973.1 uncharacterized protein LOC109827378 [Asparagus officinalis]XP_020249974.1 uncharacterized protein LOC109827378 [Asparagus officinalis]XP_020249975.1 uncharacterized protein LOC109827378 [Asparagus officinalis]ONK55421.1 uncharacterized protein A4U43_UnF3590 [Asparagus officinalis]